MNSYILQKHQIKKTQDFEEDYNITLGTEDAESALWFLVMDTSREK